MESGLMNKQQFAAHCDRTVKWLEKAQADGHVTPIMRGGRCYYRPERRDEVRARTKGKGGDGGVLPHIQYLRDYSRHEAAALGASMAEYNAWRDAQDREAERLERECQTLAANEAARLTAFDDQHISESVLLERLDFDAAARYLRGGWVSRESRSLGLELVETLVQERRLTPVARNERRWMVSGRPDLPLQVRDTARYFTKAEACEAEAWLKKHGPKTAPEQKLAAIVAKTAAAEGKPDKLQQFFVELYAVKTAPPEQRERLARTLIANFLRPDP